MGRILDTTPAFQRFAGMALDVQDVEGRQEQWWQHYHAAHPDVFGAFFATHGDVSGLPTVLRNLRAVRQRAQAAAVHMPDLIEAIEPAVAQVLGAGAHPEPLHVLLVGTLSTNAFVAPLDGELAVFHCLEWFAAPGPAAVLVAHEDAHAWHRRRVDPPAEPDLAWEALAEGLALQASRAAVPDHPEQDYFWYGMEGFEDWLPWCRDHRDLLLDEFRRSLDDPDAVEVFFGGGFLHDHWRTGFYVADVLVDELDLPLAELAGLDVTTGRRLVRQALGRS